MDSTVTAATIAAVAAAVGWLVNHILSERSERNRNKHRARLSHVERQLEELYGPLFFLLHEGTASFKDFSETVGRNIFFANGSISSEDLNTWLFWVDNDLMPRNSAIQVLLSTKAHLIDAPRMPASYIAFIDHHSSWRVSHLRWKEEGVPYRWHSRTNWPREFELDVIATYEKLKRIQEEISGILVGA
ncbi:hypothetical protein [Streptomyces sp. CBMA152]|uniref:hypothetical protein n=1 Tax=Streptomyces sp. CBMA152 TaxID=1896312 RepID=UPI0016613D51|nr:hypothetical protein [Streptomyces sp. CBMA152]MBD0743828.1 hypothetical protein [Streptomyces sp. CBMA152]